MIKKQIVVMFVVWLFTGSRLCGPYLEGDAIRQGVDESGRSLVQKT